MEEKIESFNTNIDEWNQIFTVPVSVLFLSLLWYMQYSYMTSGDGTVYVLYRVLFWSLFPLLLCNLGNKHQNNPFANA